MLFSDCAIVPLSLPRPKLDLGTFRDFVHRFCNRCAFTGNTIRYVSFFARKPLINARLIESPCELDTLQLTRGTPYEWDPHFKKLFPTLVQWIEALPFTKLQDVVLITATGDIPEHLDIFGAENAATIFDRFNFIEPRLYRLLIAERDDTRARSEAFYVTEEYGGRRSYLRLPATTDCFALSSSVCYHGSRFLSGHFKTIVAINGELDVARHLSLLAESSDRFRDYTIRVSVARPVSDAELPYRGPI
jgi:hypothetical protein